MGNTLSAITKRAVDFLGNRAKSVSDILSGLWASTDQKYVTEETVLTITPAWRAIYILKDILSTMPLNLYHLQDDGDIVLAKDHRLNKLVAFNPHPLYTPYEWMSAMMVNTLIAGNGISKIHRDNAGNANGLEIIPFDKIRDILVSYEGVPHLQYILQTGQVLHGDDVIHFQGLSINALAGLNTTRTHRETLSSEVALRDFIKSFLDKGAFLSGVIEVPVQLQEASYKRMKSSWQDSYGGAKKAGGTAILEQGAKYNRIQATIPETGYDLVKGASIADISRIYGVPEYMLDSKNKPTYASIEHISLDFKKYTVDGWCTKIVQELTRKLVSSNQAGQYFFEYDKSGLTTGDLETMGEYYQKLYNMSVLNPNEIRKSIRLNKVEHGDRYMVQGNNMIPADKIDDAMALKGSNEKSNADMQTIKEK